MEITERAGNYAEGKANEAITKAIAQAYADGYRDGYKDREEEIPVDLRDNKTEYVDLGLPSGTLWSNDYEEENGETLYLPYGKAAKYAIPTEEQWNELFEYCRCTPAYLGTTMLGRTKYVCGYTFVGPNGNGIEFNFRGYKIDNVIESRNDRYFFWLLNSKEGLDKKCCVNNELKDFFSGYKLPVRLVRKK